MSLKLPTSLVRDLQAFAMRHPLTKSREEHPEMFRVMPGGRVIGLTLNK